MKSFSQELYDISIKVQEKKKRVKKLKPVKKTTPRERAELFLSNLKERLKRIARQGEFDCPVLRVTNDKFSEESLNMYERLIYKGCKKMGLHTQITELFETHMGERESTGNHIYVRWSKD